MPKERDLRAVHAEANRIIQEVSKSRQNNVYLKMDLLTKARAELVKKGVTEDVMSKISLAVSRCLNEELKSMRAENDEEGLGMSEGQILDDAEGVEGISEAVKIARAAGITDPKILELVSEFAARTADFLIAQDQEHLPIPAREDIGIRSLYDPDDETY